MRIQPIGKQSSGFLHTFRRAATRRQALFYMKNKQILKAHISPKIFSLFITMLFLALMLPVIYIGKYDKPSADDYGYAVTTHHVWNATHSIPEVLKAVTDRVASSYRTWQGTYSSIFMMALNPAAFDYRLYKLVPSIMITMLSLSCFLTAKLVFCDLLRHPAYFAIGTGSALSILTIEKMHTTPSGLFWYNSAVHYTFMHACMILMLCFIVKMLGTDCRWKKILFCLCTTFFAIMSAGSNYATSLMGIVLLVTVMFLWIPTHKNKLSCSLRNLLWGLFPLFAYSIGFILNITAPGNQIRQEAYQGFSPIQSILMSFQSAAVYSIKWFDLFTLLMLLLLLPLLWNSLSETNFCFSCPLLVILYSFCIVACGFTSSYYSMGTEGLSRTHNVIKITWQFLLVLNEFYLLGWLKHYLTVKKGKATAPIPIYAIGIAGLLIMMTLTVFLSDNKAGTFTTYASVYYVKTKEAQMFYNEYRNRVALLESSEPDIVLPPYQFQPWLLYIDDITIYPDDWRNKMVQDWYGKASVRLEP